MGAPPKVDPPRLPLGNPERHTECQDAIAGTFTKMLDDAEAAGWNLPEICDAVIDLADDILLQEADMEQIRIMLGSILARKNSQ